MEDFKENWYQIFGIISMSISFCSVSASYAWTSPSIPILTSEDFPGDITLEQASYLTVIGPIGMVIGSYLFSSFVDKIGRKKTLLLIALSQVSSWIIIMFAESIYLFYFSRFVFGLAHGGVNNISPIYIREVTKQSVRESWSNFLTTTSFFGFFLVNAFGGFCSIKTTAYILVTLPVCYFLTFSLMPESPYILIMRQKEERARQSLQILRRKENVEYELTQLISDVQNQIIIPESWKDLFLNPTRRRAFIVGTVVRAAQKFSGAAAFETYTIYFFQHAGADFSATGSAMIFTLLITIMNVFSVTILNKLGRRLAMVCSSAGCAVILLSISMYFYFKDHTDFDVSYITFFPVLAMFLYVVLYSIGLRTIPGLFIGEVLSISIKSKGIFALNIMFVVYEATVTKLFLYLSVNYGMFSPFLLFGSSCILSTVLSFYIILETEGKTLEEIQQIVIFRKKKENEIS